MTTITSKTRLTEAEIRGLGAARTLKRRMRARHLYRVRRDRKIAVDWLGREYKYSGMRMRLVGYDPNNNTIRLQVEWRGKTSGFTWDSDQFWSLLRSGLLKEV